MEIIGLAGKAGSGKDFVGREVLRPAGYRQWSFAWPMKNTAVGRGFTYDEVHNTKPPAVRAMLQQIGTEEGWMKYGKNYWTDIAGAWLRTIEEHYGIKRFYMPDTRFEHEVDFIHSLGGKVVRLELGDRPSRLQHDKSHTGATCPACHASETALDNYTGFDLTIVNGLDATAEEIRHALLDGGIITPDPYTIEIPSIPFDQLDLFDRQGTHFLPCSS